MALIYSVDEISVGDILYTIFESGSLIKFLVSSKPQLRYNSYYFDILIFKNKNSTTHEKFNKSVDLLGITNNPQNRALTFNDKELANEYVRIIKQSKLKSINFDLIYNMFISMKRE